MTEYEIVKILHHGSMFMCYLRIQNQDYNIEVGLPPGCTKDNCMYYVAMGPNAEDGEFLDVYLQGTVEGWVAVGFSLDQMMVCVDAAT